MCCALTKMIYCFLVQPTIKIAPDDQIVKEDEPVYLHCLAVSTPAAKISWTKDNNPVRGDVSGYTLFPNGTLFIAKAKPLDTGTYKCSADHPGSWTVNADATLVVMGEFIIGGFDFAVPCEIAHSNVQMETGRIKFTFCQKFKSVPRKITWIWGHAISELETFV